MIILNHLVQRKRSYKNVLQREIVAQDLTHINELEHNVLKQIKNQVANTLVHEGN